MPTVTTDTTTETSNTNPHIREKHSPLESLIFQALRRYGDFSPGTLDGDVGLMFLEFANMVIDDIRMHPYAPSTTTTTTSGTTTTTTTTPVQRIGDTGMSDTSTGSSYTPPPSSPPSGGGY